MATILFPTDFSQTAHNAFQYALHLAETLDARIVLMHVYHEHNEITHVIPPEFAASIRMGKIDQAKRHFQAYQKEAQKALGKSVEVDTLLLKGNTRQKIVEFSESGYYDFIVMGTQGAASDVSRPFGSVAGDVILSSSCPVLAIPAEVTFQKIEHIVYAMGFEEKDFSIIERLLSLAEALGATLSCVHIRNSRQGWDRIDTSQFQRLYTLSEEEKPLEFFISNHTDVVHGLQEYVTGNKADMLAMLTHKKQFLELAKEESLSQKMALYTDVPLLVFQ